MDVKEYRKRPIVVSAYQTEEEIEIETLEGKMTASPGDYIITGINGEQYPCKQEIFEKTYDLVDDLLACEKSCEDLYDDTINIEYSQSITYYANPMFARIAEKIQSYNGGILFIFFGNGSVRLEIDNNNNYIKFNEKYTEIYNAAEGETTLIKNDEIKGFIFEDADTNLMLKEVEAYLEDA